MDFDSLEQLEKSFNIAVAKSLQTTVLEKVKDIMVEEIQTEVYDAYKSEATNPYERTGRLKDRDNIKGTIIGENLLQVVNDRGKTAKGKDISTVIQSGVGYTWKLSEIYYTKMARPFYTTTTYRIKGSNLRDIVNALKVGLKPSGFNLE